MTSFLCRLFVVACLLGRILSVNAYGQATILSSCTGSSVCVDDVCQYSIPDGSAQGNWFIQPTDAGTVHIRTGQGYPAMEVTWTKPGIQAYVYFVYSNLPSPIITPPYEVSIAAAPVVQLGSYLKNTAQITKFCPGKSYVFELQGAISGAISFQWTASDPQIQITQDPSVPTRATVVMGNQPATLSLTGSSSCGGSSAPVSVELPLLEVSTGNIAIRGPLQVCPGRAYRYEVTAPITEVLYAWAGSPGVSVRTAPDGLSAQVTFNTFTNGTEIVTLTATHPCTGQSIPVSVTVSPRRAEAVQKVVFDSQTLQNGQTQNLPAKSLYLNTCQQTDAALCGNQTLTKATLRAVFSTGNIHTLTQNFSSKVYLSIQAVNAANQSVSIGITNPVILSITQDSPEQWFSLDFTATHSQIDHLEVKLANTPSGNAPSVYLPAMQLKVFYEEEYVYDARSVQIVPLNQHLTQGYEYEFQWQPSQCPFTAGYEFQLLREFKKGTGQTVLPPADWSQALSLETESSQTSLRLTIAEGSGTYQWRVRAIGNLKGGIANPKNWGTWSQAVPFSFVQPDEANSQPGTNWIYSRTFTEGGRVSEQMSFANGLGQVVQTQAKIQSQEQVVVSETRQDYTGRNALQTLPVPVANKTHLGYMPKFLTVGASTENYAKERFDSDASYNNPAPARATDYYAGVNVSAVVGEESQTINSNVPSAEGYPFTRTLYMADGTGRVKEQSGVGVDHKLGTTHTVKTYYSGVSDAELVQLFGKEAPKAANVHKTITVDPNGTSSVSYLTKDGKVLATALIASRAASPLEDLESEAQAGKDIVETLSERMPFNGIGTLTQKPLHVTEPNGTPVTFAYTITPEQLTDLCSGSFCQTCDYQVTIQVRNQEEPNEIIPIGTLTLTPDNCGTLTPVTMQTASPTLAQGSYLIEKRVVAYNRTTQNELHLDEQLAALAQYYNPNAFTNTTSWLGADPVWVQIQTFLHPSSPQAEVNLKGFYQYLESVGSPKVIQERSEDNKLTAYLVLVPGNCETYVRIPVVALCEPLVCDASLDFEAYFASQLNKSLSTVLNEQAAAGWQAGEFTGMITRMLADSYSCERLWNCWQGVVSSYKNSLNTTPTDPTDAGTGLTPAPFSLLESFLQCTGADKNTSLRVIARPESPSQEDRQLLYKALWVDTQDSKTSLCLQGITGNANTPLSELDATQSWQLYQCIRYGQVLTDEQNEALSTKLINALYEKVQKACSDRREEFRQQIVDDIHARGKYIEGDEYELIQNPWTDRWEPAGDLLPEGHSFDYALCQIRQMTDALVNHCQQSVSREQFTVLTISPVQRTTAQASQAAALELAIKRVLLAKTEVVVDGSGLCSSTYTTIRVGSGSTPVDPPPSNQPSTVRKVLSMDGEKHSFSVPPASSLAFSDAFSASFWLMRKGGAQFELLHKYRESDYDGWGIEYFPGGLRIWITNKYIWVPCTLPQNQWVHLVVTNSATHLKVYRNKIPIFSQQINTPIVDNAQYYLMNGAGVLGIGKFAGYMDELSLYGQVLDQEQVNDLFNTRGKAATVTATTVPATYGLNPAAVWTFDQSEGTEVADQTTHANTLYLSGFTQPAETTEGGANRWQSIVAVAVNTNELEGYWSFEEETAPVAGRIQDRSCHNHQAVLGSGAQVVSEGYIGRSLRQNNGSQAAAQVPGFSWQPGAFSVAFWVRPAVLGGTLLSSGTDFSCQLSLQGQLQIALAGVSWQSNVGLMDVGEWQHIGVTYANGTLQIYKNAELVGSQSGIAGAGNWQGLLMGMLEGEMDEIQLYQTALSTAQIQFLVEVTTPVTTRVCPVAGNCAVAPNFCFKWGELLVDPDNAGGSVVVLPAGMEGYVLKYQPKSCNQQSAATLTKAIDGQMYSYADKQLAAWRSQYQTTCVAQDGLVETFTVSYRLGYHHFTLYYYDRAGNLIRTVPPAGVDQAFRADPTLHDGIPEHKLVTDYVYNSLGQLVEQTTPDGGRTRFYYNGKSQLRFSQNARQLADNHFSYTRYDELGRVTEVGESVVPQGLNLASKVEDRSYPASGTQVTRTVYSTPSLVDYGVVSGIFFPQRHLQNRVSYSYLDVDGNDATVDDRHSSYYSYDAHGNVEWVIQEIPGLGRKHIRYEYDLISGKVLKVLYQEQTAEQFYHRYAYDEDNRLTAVETSKDGVIWEKDASYEYYRHGPLKRMELGEDKIQGVDYTYTIHGWLKAINHPDLTSAHDPGEDGIVRADGIRVPVDAFGMALSYYQGDYVRNGGLHQGNIQKPIHTQSENRSLYNGNISAWTSQIQQASSGQSEYPNEGLTAEQYIYDELNRITSSRFASYQNNQFVNGQDYATSYEYDANGNIVKLNRNSFQPQGSALEPKMDRLTYHYYANSNKLSYVTEAAGATTITDDIEDQPAENYNYDGIGQLVKDTQDGTEISWSVYNKVSSVVKTDGSRIDYQYDAQGNRIRKTVTRGSDVKTTYYVRDAQGNVLAIYDNNGGNLSQKEVYLYGSSRLGVYKPVNRVLNTTTIATRSLQEKEYELTDHLGNVRAVVGDFRQGGGSDPIRAALRSYYHFYAFGLPMPGRSYNPQGSRYGFNGKENDKEWGTGGLIQDYGFRLYSPALGRFLSVDPLAPNYPWNSTYAFAENDVISNIDLDGLEKISFAVTMQNDQARMQIQSFIDVEYDMNTQQLGIMISYGGAALKLEYNMSKDANIFNITDIKGLTNLLDHMSVETVDPQYIYKRYPQVRPDGPLKNINNVISKMKTATSIVDNLNLVKTFVSEEQLANIATLMNTYKSELNTMGYGPISNELEKLGLNKSEQLENQLVNVSNQLSNLLGEHTSSLRITNTIPDSEKYEMKSINGKATNFRTQGLYQFRLEKRVQNTIFISLFRYTDQTKIFLPSVNKTESREPSADNTKVGSGQGF